jgi:hypothetical protein
MWVVYEHRRLGRRLESVPEAVLVQVIDVTAHDYKRR